VEVCDLDLDSPLRARDLLTVRAAISSARFSDAPPRRSLSLMCSYWALALALGLTSGPVRCGWASAKRGAVDVCAGPVDLSVYPLGHGGHLPE